MADNAYDLIDNQLSKMQEQLRDEDAADVADVRSKIVELLKTVEENRHKRELREFVEKQLDFAKSAKAEPDGAVADKILELTAQLIESEIAANL